MKHWMILMLVASLFLGAAAQAQHVDVRPYLNDGKIVIGTAELRGATVVPLSDHQRVFGADFGEADPSQPFFGDDPGFMAESAAFPGGAGAFLGFDVLSGLQYWTGSGFAQAPSGELLMVAKGSQSLTVGNAGTSGFYFTAIGANEGFHEHLEWQLGGPDGDPPPGNGVAPTTGVYLLELQVKTTMPGVANSAPFWIVFNSGDETAHGAALDWAQANYAPEPASMALFVAAGLIVLGRRGSANQRRPRGVVS